VAARQVSFEKTASQLLEKKLNHELGVATGGKFEVLNFGVGNFGLSQYYLTWQNYASKFDSKQVLNLSIETKNRFSGKSKSFPAGLSINHVNLKLIGELSKVNKKIGKDFIAIDTFKHHSK
jgi:hypothetical protein